MKPCLFDKAVTVGLLVLLAIAIGCSGVGAAPPATEDENGSPPFSGNEVREFVPGTPVYVRLQHSISSETAEPGESFSAVLDEPLMLEGKTVIPEGTEISGHVVAARKYDSVHHSSYVRLTLSSVVINGKPVPLQTSSIFVQGASFNNRNMAYVGGGLGSGTLIDSKMGFTRKSGAASVAYITGKKEVGFTAERRIGFRLLQPLNIG